MEFENEVLSEAVAQAHELEEKLAVEVDQTHVETDWDRVRILSQRFDFLFESGPELQLRVMCDQSLLHFELVVRMFNLMLQELLTERIVVERLSVVSTLGRGAALASGPL